LGIIPKRHHFVAEMHQQRFADDDDRLYFYNSRRPEDGVQRTSAGNLFCEGHLYSDIAADGTKDPKLEYFFSALESKVNFIIEKIVTAARLNRHPELTPRERIIWDRFFALQFKRVPDLHRRVASFDDFISELEKYLQIVLEHRPDMLDQVVELRKPEAQKRLYHNIRVDVLLKPSGEVEETLSKRGLAVIRIALPNKSFIIGSNPVVKFTLPDHTNILDHRVEAWLPIAHDVAVGVGLHAGTESFVPVTDPSSVRHINQAIAAHSSMYAGRSKELLCSLSGKPYRGRD
jgi:hypothetical protein